MEFIIDSVNLDEIREVFDYLQMQGVTSNPSIIAKELSLNNDFLRQQNFYSHMQTIESLIGPNASLHIQTVALKAEDIIEEAYLIKKHISKYAYVKIPATKEGLKAIKLLKAADRDFRITATAIYTTFQAFYAITLNVDYIVPYVNRIESLNNDPYKLISDSVALVKRDNYKTEVLAASFKNTEQIIKAISAGSVAITASYDLLLQVFKNPHIDVAIETFKNDWQTVFGVGSGIRFKD